MTNNSSGFVINVKRFFAKIVDVKANELHALLPAFVFNFVVLGGYYVIRPIRDEIGADRGRRKSTVDVHRHADRHADR